MAGVVGVAVVAAIVGAIIFFDTEPKSPDSGDEIDLDQEVNQSELAGPDSGEEEDNQGPDSGDEVDPNEPTSPDSGDEEDNQGPDSGDDADNQGPDSGDEITLNEDLKNRAKGSCNVIAEGSTCVEYIGSYWTVNNAKLNCSGNFYTNPCPRPALGGCRLGADTPNDMVTWHYSYGGDPYTEVIQYAAGSCRAIGGWWVN